jgi:hypothetical protein
MGGSSLVDLGDGTVEEDDRGVVEALERVVARELEVVLQPREGVRHFRRRRSGVRVFDETARGGRRDEQLAGGRELSSTCSLAPFGFEISWDEGCALAVAEGSPGRQGRKVCNGGTATMDV